PLRVTVVEHVCICGDSGQAKDRFFVCDLGSWKFVDNPCGGIECSWRCLISGRVKQVVYCFWAPICQALYGGRLRSDPNFWIWLHHQFVIPFYADKCILRDV